VCGQLSPSLHESGVRLLPQCPNFSSVSHVVDRATLYETTANSKLPSAASRTPSQLEILLSAAVGRGPSLPVYRPCARCSVNGLAACMSSSHVLATPAFGRSIALWASSLSEHGVYVADQGDPTPVCVKSRSALGGVCMLLDSNLRRGYRRSDPKRARHECA
jgi:hypothetical protein